MTNSNPACMTLDILASLASYRAEQDDTPLAALGIDSFDLMALRVAVEQHVGRAIPDRVWIAFNTFADIKRYCATGVETRDTTARRIRVNMPHMAVGGLSESWLFRELGDLHWTMLCEALGTASDAITDAMGNRLYATFVRIEIRCDVHLKAVRENDELAVSGQLSRYGASVWLNDMSVRGNGHGLRAQLMSTFAQREGNDNMALLRGEPAVPGDCPIVAHATMPPLMTAYRASRATVPRRGGGLATLSYTLNPYTDFNGVNLLYFAAYPTIHDTIERQCVHAHRSELGVTGDWAERSATVQRTVNYFANCAITDAVAVQIEGCSRDGDRLTCSSVLYRESDGAPMACVESVKAIL